MTKGNFFNLASGISEEEFMNKC